MLDQQLDGVRVERDAPLGRKRTAKMDEPRDYQLVSADQTALKKEIAKPDAGATPFKLVVDPEMRSKLRRALNQKERPTDLALPAAA